MTNKNFEDIDQLFREGLNPDVQPMPFQEGDWSKLEQRLDRNERWKRGIFWLSRLGGVAALILLFFAIRMLWPEGATQVIQQAEVQQKDQKIKEEKNQSITSPKGKEIVITSKPGSNSSLVQNKPLKEVSTHKHSIANSLEISIADHDTLQGENLNVQKETTEPTSNSKEQIATQPNIVKSPERKRSSDEEPLYKAIEEPYEQPISELPMRRLALSLLAAPDYNGVNNLNNASLGNDFGLLISYKIAKNWSFSTGGIYAKKLYETGFSNYTPAHNIWTEYYPKSVNADCRVLDIPLNINYTFLKRKNNTISAGSGISSYIMLREDYRFDYAENDNNSPLSYHVANENQHWLSVLNLQASFEQRLSSRVSISLQPYMKIPLSDIGFAGVKLQSFGMAANLNWNFNL